MFDNGHNTNVILDSVGDSGKGVLVPTYIQMEGTSLVIMIWWELPAMGVLANAMSSYTTLLSCPMT